MSIMAKQKKKRNKQYTGQDAAVTKATVTRISAVQRSAFGQWWFDHKRVARPVGIGVIVAIVVIAVIIQLIALAH
jgi:hypothetical protein